MTHWNNLMEKAWEEFTKKPRKPATLKYYRQTLEEFMDYTNASILAADDSHANRYYQHLLASMSSNKLKGTTAYKKFKVLNSFCEFLVLSDSFSIDINPFKRYLLFLKEYDQTNISRTLSLSETDRLLSACEQNLFAFTIISLVYRTAMKPQDICQLKIHDFFSDPSGTYIQLHKNSRIHIVALTDDIIDLLNTYIQRYHLDLSESSQYFFLNRLSRPLNERYLERMMKFYCKKAGISTYTLHDVRSTCASVMYSYQVQEEDISRKMNIGIQGIRRYNKNIPQADLLKRADQLVKIQILPPSNKEEA